MDRVKLVPIFRYNSKKIKVMLDPSKIQDLFNGVGKEFSDNFSKTCRAELVQVLTKGGNVKCIVRDVDAYGKKGGTVRVEPGWSTWNAMYF